MIKDIAQFYLDSQELVNQFNLFVSKNNLEKISRADHICYKCDSREEFESMRNLLEKESNYIYQSIISERRIAIVKLKREIETNLGRISILELSDQKPDMSQKSKFDHIEIYPVGISYKKLIEHVEMSKMPMKKVVRPHHTTIDIEIGKSYLVRLEEEPLLDKIKRAEMV